MDVSVERMQTAVKQRDPKAVISALRRSVLNAERTIQRTRLSDIRLSLTQYQHDIQSTDTRRSENNAQNTAGSLRKFGTNGSLRPGRNTSGCYSVVESSRTNISLPVNIQDIRSDILHSAVCTCPGSCDQSDRNMIFVNCQHELWVEDNVVEFVKLLLYYCSICSPFHELTCCSSISVIVDMRSVTVDSINLFLKTLALIKASVTSSFGAVYILTDSQLNLPTLFQSVATVKVVRSIDELQSFIDRTCLPVEFNGLLQFSHSNWVSYQLSLEGHASECYNVSYELCCVAERLMSCHHTLPASATSCQSALTQHEQQVTTALQHISTNRLITTCEMPSDILRSQFTAGCIYCRDVKELQQQISDSLHRLQSAADKRLCNIQQCLQLRHFESLAGSVYYWLVTEAGDTLNKFTSVSNVSLVDQEEFQQFLLIVQMQQSKMADVSQKANDLLTSNTGGDVTGARKVHDELQTRFTAFLGQVDNIKDVMTKRQECCRIINQVNEWVSATSLYFNNTTNVDLSDLEVFLTTNLPPATSIASHIKQLLDIVKCEQLSVEWEFVWKRSQELMQLIQHRRSALKDCQYRSGPSRPMSAGNSILQHSRRLSAGNSTLGNSTCPQVNTEYHCHSLNTGNTSSHPSRLLTTGNPINQPCRRLSSGSANCAENDVMCQPPGTGNSPSHPARSLSSCLQPTVARPLSAGNPVSQPFPGNSTHQSCRPLSAGNSVSQSGNLSVPVCHVLPTKVVRTPAFDVRDYFLGSDCSSKPLSSVSESGFFSLHEDSLDTQTLNTPQSDMDTASLASSCLTNSIDISCLTNSIDMSLSNIAATSSRSGQQQTTETPSTLTGSKQHNCKTQSMLTSQKSATLSEAPSPKHSRPRWKFLQKAASLLTDKSSTSSSQDDSPRQLSIRSSSIESLPSGKIGKSGRPSSAVVRDSQHPTEGATQCKYGWLSKSSRVRQSKDIYADGQEIVSHCPSVPTTTNLTDESQQQQQRRTLSLVMQELLQTEKDYVDALHYIVLNYIPQMNRDDLPQPLRGKKCVVFGNIERIFEFHSNYFLQKIEECVTMPFQLGTCFLQHETDFYLYSLYSKNKPRSDELMTECGSLYFMTKQKQLGDYMDLSSYLLKPIQRLGKYALLLKQIARDCPKTHPASADILAALDMVHFQLRHGNDLLAMDGLRKCDVNLQEQGMLLRQEDFLVCHRRKKCLRRVFLFEELIVFSKTCHSLSGHDTYVYKNSIKTSEVGLTESVSEAGDTFELWFRKRLPGSTYTLRATATQVRSEWVDDIACLLWKQALHSREIHHAESSVSVAKSKKTPEIRSSVDSRLSLISYSTNSSTTSLYSPPSPGSSVFRRGSVGLGLGPPSPGSLRRCSLGVGKCVWPVPTPPDTPATVRKSLDGQVTISCSQRQLSTNSCEAGTQTTLKRPGKKHSSADGSTCMTMSTCDVYLSAGNEGLLASMSSSSLLAAAIADDAIILR